MPTNHGGCPLELQRRSSRLLVAFSIVSANPSVDSSTTPTYAREDRTLAAQPNKTIGESTDAFMGKSSMGSRGTAQDGTEFVNVRGEIRFMDKPVEAVLQFQINRRLGTFEVRALEFNGIPQNLLVQAAFLEKMYESSH